MGSRELLREGVRHHSPDGRANQRADSACTDKRRRRVNSSVSGQLGGLYQERGWPFAIYGVFLNTIALGEQMQLALLFLHGLRTRNHIRVVPGPVRALRSGTVTTAAEAERRRAFP